MSVYWALLKKYPLFSCPYCSSSVYPIEFHFHCHKYHSFKSTKRCLWCLGSVRWEKEEKPPMDHLVNCFKNFMYHLPPLFQIVSFDWKPLYVSQRTTPLPWRAVQQKILPLQHKGMELAAAAIHTFLEWSQQKYFYHMALNEKFPLDSHLQAKVLPFSCQCGTHRHVIVYLSEHLSPSPRCRRILSPLQLTRILGQVARNNQTCSLGFTTVSQNATILLPPGYDIVCVLQWKGGILEWIQEWFERVDPKELVSVAQSFQGLWGVRIGNLPGLPRQLVLPVHKQLEPHEKEGRFCIEWVQGKKLYFSINPDLEKMNAEQWIQYQTERGNSIFESIQDEIWFPTPHQQQCIRLARLLMEKLSSKDVENKDSG